MEDYAYKREGIKRSAKDLTDAIARDEEASSKDTKMTLMVHAAVLSITLPSFIKEYRPDKESKE